MKITKDESSAQIEEKKSRFLTLVKGISSEEEASAFLKEVKKKYCDASHHCFAYVLGDARQIQRASDDGEPQGCAGRPILDTLLQAEMTDTIIVVIRYYGGIQLGKGGLIRAYRSAAAAGLDASMIYEKVDGCVISMIVEYAQLDRLNYFLEKSGITNSEIEYLNNVRVKILIEQEQKDVLEQMLIDAFGNAIQIKDGGEMEILRPVIK